MDDKVSDDAYHRCAVVGCTGRTHAPAPSAVLILGGPRDIWLCGVGPDSHGARWLRRMVQRKTKNRRMIEVMLQDFMQEMAAEIRAEREK